MTHHAVIASIGPKVSVLIDGGGALHLDEQPGDLRLRAGMDSRLHLGIAGTAASSTSLGWLEPQHALEAIVQVLTSIARRGPRARGRAISRTAAAWPRFVRRLHACSLTISRCIRDRRPTPSALMR